MPRLNPSITPPSPRCKVFTWVLSTPEIRGGLKNELIRERLMMHIAQVSHLNGYDRFKIIKTNGELVARGRWYDPKGCSVSVLWKPWKVLMGGGKRRKHTRNATSRSK